MMRIFTLLLLTVCCTQVRAQQTVISTGPIQIGIQVKKTADVIEKSPGMPGSNLDVGDLYDISSLCQGFNEDGLPMRLVIPYGSEIILFSPTIKKENAVKYRFRHGTGVNNIPNDFSYLYKGDSVGLFKPQITENGTGFISIEGLDRIIMSPTVTRSASNSLLFTYKIDLAPLRFDDIYLFSEGDELSKFAIDQLNHALTNQNRDYSSWLKKGYADSLDQNGFPVNSTFPHTEEGFFMRTFKISATGNILLAGGGEYKRIDRDSELTPDMVVIGGLKPGNYRLIIEEPQKNYGEKSIYFTFTIKASFWDRGGYWVVTLVPLFIIIFFLYRYYTKRRIKKIDLLQRLSEAELKAIRAQLNPHFLFNALNAIQNLVNKGETEIANEYIVKLSRLLRMVLSQSDDAFHSLLNELEISRLYLELEKMRTPFTYTIKVEENVDENMLIPSMILQPYLENAVVHGIANNEADKINVSIFYQDESCILEIEDNGKNSSGQKGEGKGMKLGKERLEIIKRQLGKGVNTSVQARFLPDGGYRVSITIPKDL